MTTPITHIQAALHTAAGTLNHLPNNTQLCGVSIDSLGNINIQTAPQPHNTHVDTAQHLALNLNITTPPDTTGSSHNYIHYNWHGTTPEGHRIHIAALTKRTICETCNQPVDTTPGHDTDTGAHT